MRYGAHETADAIKRVQSLLQNSEELLDYPDARRDVQQIQCECWFLLGEFEDEFLVAGIEELQIIKNMERWLLSLDLQCRPNE